MQFRKNRRERRDRRRDNNSDDEDPDIIKAVPYPTHKDLQKKYDQVLAQLANNNSHWETKYNTLKQKLESEYITRKDKYIRRINTQNEK